MKRVGPGGVFAAIVAAVLIGVSGGFGLRVGFGQPQWHDEVKGRLWPVSSRAPTSAPNGSTGPGTQPVGNSSTFRNYDILQWLVQPSDLDRVTSSTITAAGGFGASPTRLNTCMPHPITDVSGNAASAWARLTWTEVSGNDFSYSEEVAEAPDAETAQAWALQLYEWHATCKGKAASDISRPALTGGSATVVNVWDGTEVVGISIVMRVVDKIAVGYLAPVPRSESAVDELVAVMALGLGAW